MKTTNLRSMRNIPTIQGLKNRMVPDTSEQVISELARLEHEKARLERENKIWVSNQRKAQARIDTAQARIDLLRGILEELSPRKVDTQPSGVEAPKKNPKYREVTLDY